jgi:hypothetical protein
VTFVDSRAQSTWSARCAPAHKSHRADVVMCSPFGIYICYCYSIFDRRIRRRVESDRLMCASQPTTWCVTPASAGRARRRPPGSVTTAAGEGPSSWSLGYSIPSHLRERSVLG